MPNPRLVEPLGNRRGCSLGLPRHPLEGATEGADVA
jgi:hypothetical protein